MVPFSGKGDSPKYSQIMKRVHKISKRNTNAVQIDHGGKLLRTRWYGTHISICLSTFVVCKYCAPKTGSPPDLTISRRPPHRIGHRWECTSVLRHKHSNMRPLGKRNYCNPTVRIVTALLSKEGPSRLTIVMGVERSAVLPNRRTPCAS